MDFIYLYIQIEIHKISIDDDKKKVYLDLSAEDTIIRFIEHEEKLQTKNF
jgi:hypothetical protein